MSKKNFTKEQEYRFYGYCASKVEYNKETGLFIWKNREGNTVYVKIWNTKNAGKEIATISAQGYKYTSLKYMEIAPKILLHRLAWFIVHNEVPPNLIDHINQVRTDNRIENLRVCNHLENNRNQKMRNTNTSGITGVTWSKANGKWVAACWLNGKRKYLGYYADINEAKNVVESFRLLNGYSELHGKATKENQ